MVLRLQNSSNQRRLNRVVIYFVIRNHYPVSIREQAQSHRNVYCIFTIQEIPRVRLNYNSSSLILLTSSSKEIIRSSCINKVFFPLPVLWLLVIQHCTIFIVLVFLGTMSGIESSGCENIWCGQMHATHANKWTNERESKMKRKAMETELREINIIVQVSYVI